jgi:4'-phosphopantetheinyl transferase
MPTLEAGEVHIWTTQSNPQDTSLASLHSLLSPSEVAAANRFVFDHSRKAYVFAHGVLRQILGGYVDLSPEEIRFEQTRFGKPFLAGPHDQARVRFNMSHSGDAVLVAITRDRHIGADIERIRPLDFAGIVNSHFTAQECAFIRNQPTEKQQNAFFTCWTRKEAFIKAVGKGLSIPLNTFDVCIPSGQTGRKLTAPNEAPDVESWWLTDVIVPLGYAGAIAIEGRLVEVVYKTWKMGS